MGPDVHSYNFPVGPLTLPSPFISCRLQLSYSICEILSAMASHFYLLFEFKVSFSQFSPKLISVSHLTRIIHSICTCSRSPQVQAETVELNGFWCYWLISFLMVASILSNCCCFLLCIINLLIISSFSAMLSNFFIFN